MSEVVRQDVNGSYMCDYATDYVFEDSHGGRHALQLSITSCSETSPLRTAVTRGGEGAILATTAQPVGSFSVPPVTVTDADGTRYIFNQPAKEAGLNGFSAEFPDIIEDRNGNQIAVADAGAGAVSLTDTVGRTLLASSGFGLRATRCSCRGRVSRMRSPGARPRPATPSTPQWKAAPARRPPA